MLFGSTTNQVVRRATCPALMLDGNVMAPHAFEKTIFWHRELPPRDAEPIGDHTVEATSARVAGTLQQHDGLWDACYQQLMDRAAVRLQQEMHRLGGDYAHVLTEEIEPRHDDRTGEAWMYGRFDYALYRRRLRARQ